MGQLGIITRTAVVAGLVGIAASALAPQDASAFGFGGGLRGFGGGGNVHGFGGGRFGGGFHPAFGRGSIGRPLPIRFPGPHLPPIGFHPGHPVLWPPIVRHPWPRLPPIVRLPPRILPPPVIVGRPRLPIVPVAAAGLGVAVGMSAIQAPAPVASACATGGTFVEVTFVPTVTAADITTFLGSYNVTMADGPNPAGVYRIRLSDGSLPADKVASVIASMRNQTAIIAAVAGA